MKTHPTYFIFDLDGTLALSEHVHLQAWQIACKRAGIPRMTAREYNKFFGKPTIELVVMYLQRHDIDPTPALVKQLIADKREFYSGNLYLIERNEAIVGLLAALCPHYKTALVTTSMKAHAQAIIEQLGIGDLFDVMIFGDDVRRHKPDPECYRLAAKRLGARPEQCLIFEDSESGIMAARQFGGHLVKVVR